MFAAKIEEYYILETDFLRKVGLDEIMEFFFNPSQSGKEIGKNLCCRVCDVSGGLESVPENLKEFLKQNSRELNASQKIKFAELLRDIQNVLSGQIVAGNCHVL